MRKNDVIQFNEKHKWCGCLGIIDEIKYTKDEKWYMIGVPTPRGVAYMFAYDDEIEFIGVSKFGME